jgi:hypothetical protein
MALTDHTTLWAIADTAHLKSGETIQIQGGAGGVAAFGIQLAKHLGAAVITTASAGNHPARTLPIDRVEYDVAIGSCGGKLLNIVVDDPIGVVWIAPAPEGFRPPRTDVETLRPNVTRDHAHLEPMLALLYAGAVRPPTIVRYKLCRRKRSGSTQRIAPPAGRAGIRGPPSGARMPPALPSAHSSSPIMGHSS